MASGGRNCPIGTWTVISIKAEQLAQCMLLFTVAI